MLNKNLECLSTFLKRLIECRTEEPSMDDNNSEFQPMNARRILENFKIKHRHLFKNQESNKNPSTQIKDIYNEIFKDEACIINFMKILKGK